MTINNKTVLGAVVGFIPGISSIASPFKIHAYRKDKEQIEKVNKASSCLHAEEAKQLKKLTVASFFQLIPGVNIIAAAVETLFLSKLAKLQGKERYHLFYNIQHLENTTNDAHLNEALELIDSLPFKRDYKDSLANIAYGYFLSTKKNITGKEVLKELLEDELKRNEETISVLSDASLQQKKEAPQEIKIEYDYGGEVVIPARQLPPAVLASELKNHELFSQRLKIEINALS